MKTDVYKIKNDIERESRKFRLKIYTFGGLIYGALIFYSLSQFGIFGTRSTTQVDSFMYGGTPMKIMKEDRRFGRDRHWLEDEVGNIIFSGKIVSDDGIEVKIDKIGPWSDMIGSDLIIDRKKR